ncbi:MAG: hypothetical protein JNJ46_24630 [Myxococcales bacterium]|nr:hypothetical protein [Myxococcales bacterium]
MPNDFESTPYDGHHSYTDPGNDWRTGDGIAGGLGRMVSYGNWAGPNNRMVIENSEYINQQRQADAGYDPYHDPSLMNNPRYKPVDGLDAAAQRHDHGYFQSLNGENMFGWQGIRNTREADRQLVADTQAEMDTNGHLYSDDAERYSRGLRGYFGGRVMGMDAADWAGGKMNEAGQGVSNFVDSARDWRSLGDAGRGIWQGVQGAGSWLANTGREAWGGIRNAVNTARELGPVGTLGMIGGIGNVAVAGGIHAAGQAWQGAKNLGSNIASGAANMARGAGNAISSGLSTAGTALRNGAASVVSGAGNVARSAGNAVVGGAKKLWGWLSR